MNAKNKQVFLTLMQILPKADWYSDAYDLFGGVSVALSITGAVVGFGCSVSADKLRKENTQKAVQDEIKKLNA